MKKSNWEKAYEIWMNENVVGEASEKKILDDELDKTLNEWLPDEIFNEVYNKISKLVSLYEEEGFKAGYVRAVKV